MRGMIMHFALSAALVGGIGKPLAYRLPQESSPDSIGKTTVEVQNTAGLDAVIYAVQGLRRVRLGVVNGLRTQQLVLPREFTLQNVGVKFIVSPIGLRGVQVSDEIEVRRGEKLRLFIPQF